MKTLWTEVMDGGEVRFKLGVRKNGRDHRFLIEYLSRNDSKWKFFHRYDFPIEHFMGQFSDINSRMDVVWLSLEFLVNQFDRVTDKHAVAHLHHVMAVLSSYLASRFYRQYEMEMDSINQLSSEVLEQ